MDGPVIDLATPMLAFLWDAVRVASAFLAISGAATLAYWVGYLRGQVDSEARENSAMLGEGHTVWMWPDGAFRVDRPDYGSSFEATVVEPHLVSHGSSAAPPGSAAIAAMPISRTAT